MADELLNIRPDASILGVFSRLNYKPWYAIAEFVDNSTASFFANEHIMKFYKIKNILTLFSKNFIIVSDKLRNRMKEVEDIEITR